MGKQVRDSCRLLTASDTTGFSLMVSLEQLRKRMIRTLNATLHRSQQLVASEHQGAFDPSLGPA